MVKGVNKTVIEVNNTGNKFFEKIVFYVTPEYGAASARQLRQAAENFSFNLGEISYQKSNNGLRKRYKRKRKIKLFMFSGLCLAVLGTVLALIL